MANEKNLRPIRDAQRARELQEKAVAKRKENIQARKTLAEELKLLLVQDDYQQRISIAMMEKAAQGDTKAFEVIRDTIGEKPTDKSEVDSKIEIVMSADTEDYSG